MTHCPIYTIGYGNRTLDAFTELLARYGISFLVDVRSRPYSRYKPEFSKDALQRTLAQHNVRYVFMGDTLGGLPDDRALYVADKVDYDKYREQPAYRSGIARLHVANDKGLMVALMCSEGKPQECHRSKLLGATLVEDGIEVAHIDERGVLKTQAQVLEVLLGQPSLIPLPFTSRKRYSASSAEDENEGSA